MDKHALDNERGCNDEEVKVDTREVVDVGKAYNDSLHAITSRIQAAVSLWLIPTTTADLE